MNKSKILIIGNNYLTSAYALAGYEVVDNILSLEMMDLSDIQAIIYCIDETQPKIQKNWKSNFESCELLNTFCLKRNIKFVYISTGDLYGNSSDWDNNTEESTQLDVNNDYRLSKRVGERFCIEAKQSLILRVKNLFDNRLHPSNSLIKLFNRVNVSPYMDSFTYIPDLISASDFLIRNNYSGIFNITQFECASHVHIFRDILATKKYEEFTDYTFGEDFPNINNQLDNDEVVCDINSLKIKNIFPLTPLEASLSLAWKELINHIDKSQNRIIV